jgi:hypothetical protein
MNLQEYKMKEAKALSIVLTIARDSMECIDPVHLKYLAEVEGLSNNDYDTEINEAFQIISDRVQANEIIKNSEENN